MGAIRKLFRAIGGLYLLAVVVIGIGGTWLQYRVEGGETVAEDDFGMPARKAERANSWDRERSSRSYAREEEAAVREAERESMGSDPSA